MGIIPELNVSRTPTLLSPKNYYRCTRLASGGTAGSWTGRNLDVTVPTIVRKVRKARKATLRVRNVYLRLNIGHLCLCQISARRRSRPLRLLRCNLRAKRLRHTGPKED